MSSVINIIIVSALILSPILTLWTVLYLIVRKVMRFKNDIDIKGLMMESVESSGYECSVINNIRTNNSVKVHRISNGYLFELRTYVGCGGYKLIYDSDVQYIAEEKIWMDYVGIRIKTKNDEILIWGDAISLLKKYSNVQIMSD